MPEWFQTTSWRFIFHFHTITYNIVIYNSNQVVIYVSVMIICMALQYILDVYGL